MGLNSLVIAIEKWLADALPKATVKVCSADKSEFKNGVSVSFVNFRQSIDTRNTMARRDPVIDQLDVDVLLVPRDSDPMKQVTMVADLYFAALQEAPGHLASDEITNNTLINTTANPFFTTFWIEGVIKNNLLLNVYSWGEDEAYRIEQEPDGLAYSIINIDTLAGEWPMTDTTWYEREADRVLEVSNNYYGWVDELETFWASVDSINAPLWMNSRTLAMFADDVNYPGLTEEATSTKADVGLPEFVTPIQGTDDMIAYVKDVLWGGEPGFRWVWEPEGATIPNADIDWPPLEDLRLVSSGFTGDDGKPLGDKNWYPEYAERWNMTGWNRDEGDILDPTAVKDYAVLLDGISLGQNYPNPFTNETQIELSLDQSENVSLSVYDITGRRVRTLMSGQKVAGSHTVIWDGTSSSGQDLPGGMYLLHLETDSQVATARMIKQK